MALRGAAALYQNMHRGSQSDSVSEPPAVFQTSLTNTKPEYSQNIASIQTEYSQNTAIAVAICDGIVQ